MLIHTVNNSISGRNRHLTEKQVADIFRNPRLTDPINQYAADIIFQETSLQEIALFLKNNHIPFDNARRLFLLYKEFSKQMCKEKYEWFFR